MAIRDTKLNIIIDAQDRTKGALKNVSADMGKMEKTSSSLVATLGKLSVVAGTAAAGFVAYGIKVAADLETAQVGLTTLLGSSEKAVETMNRLKKEAARTPFELPGLSRATQLLSSVTKDGNKSIDILLDVGEALAAMGKGQPEMDRIIVNLQQIAAVGKAATIDIKQFAFAGIPIYEMLAETTGKTGEALAQFIEDGGVTFDLLTKMFDEANDAGGRFFGAFKNQSGTFNQAMSNLKDSFGIFLSDLVNGTGIFHGLTRAVVLAGGVLGNYKTILENVRTSVSNLIQKIDENTGLVTLLKDSWANLVFMFEERLKPALLELWATLQPLKPLLEAMVKVFGVMLVIAIGGTIMIIGALAAAVIEALALLTKWYNFLSGVFVKVWETINDAIAKVIETVDRLISKFQRALDLAKSVGGGIANKAISVVSKVVGVDDAVISPDGKVISTHPDDYLIATKRPQDLVGGRNLVININGGTYLSEDAAEEIGDLIFSRLKLSNAI